MEDNIKVQRHKAICEELTNIYRSKNKDYGDSYAKLREKYPESIFIRAADKISRLETLYKAGAVAEVKDESILDTLKDLANYFIMEAIEFDLKRNSLTELDLTKKLLEEALQRIKELEEQPKHCIIK